MPTLLFRLAGPMQSWGLSSRFTIRDTGREPSKSGVLGLLCAAMGKPAAETERDGFPTLEVMAGLRMGVRVDREGAMARDYHTAGGGDWNGRDYGVFKASGKTGDPLPTTRYYLTGAHFLVGLEGPRELLQLFDRALRFPVWQVSLGRKAFVPSIPVHLPDSPPEGPGLRDEPLETALISVPLGHPLDEADAVSGSLDRVRFVIEARDAAEGAELRCDVPLDFQSRRFGQRRVRSDFRPVDEVARR
jgi:CRISPR system Cascade subunit CasD